MRRVFSIVLFVFALVGACTASRPAIAHRLVPGAGGGIPIPSLAHGQMEVYARHWGEIMWFAARHPTADENFRRVANFARLQKAWCFWGLVPGAITDEESPFNECSHAYLAAARALLEELRETARPGSAIDRLGSGVDLELLMAGVPVVCGFSGEDFNTADHVVPDWRRVMAQTGILPLIGTSTVLMAAGLLAIRNGRRRDAGR